MHVVSHVEKLQSCCYCCATVFKVGELQYVNITHLTSICSNVQRLDFSTNNDMEIKYHILEVKTTCLKKLSGDDVTMTKAGDRVLTLYNLS